MNSRLIMASIMMLGLLLMPVTYAGPTANVQREVSALLDFVGGAGCEFYRNGTWSGPKMAQTHLRNKYQYLMARNLINTTEDFIDKAASESSISGEPYGVRCKGAATLTSKLWLQIELKRIRHY